METEKLTIESLFDEFLKISEALRTDRIQFPREEEQYLINIRYAEFKSLVKSYTRQCCIKFLMEKTIKRLGNITEISKGQILVDWRCENIEIAERDFINVGKEWDVYEIVEEKESFDLKVSRATKNLSKIKNPDKWIREMRGSI